jgi:hypothetical protein
MQGRRLAASDNWRILANEFRSLASQAGGSSLLWARWNLVVDVDPIEKWTLEGNYSFKAQFKAIASRAARELDANAVGLLSTWLRALINEMPGSLEKQPSTGVMRYAGGIEREHLFGTLRNICYASAVLNRT